jgi:hypothetical protein
MDLITWEICKTGSPINVSCKPRSHTDNVFKGQRYLCYSYLLVAQMSLVPDKYVISVLFYFQL